MILKRDIFEKSDPDIAAFQKQFQNLITDSIIQVIKQQDNTFLEVLKNLPVHPIKEPVTYGKLKWRGIKLVRTYHPSFTNTIGETWLEQRGKRISPILRTTIIGNINNV